MREISRAGFALESTEAGLVAYASRETIEDFDRNPRRLAIVAFVATKLAFIADALGGVPAQP